MNITETHPRRRAYGEDLRRLAVTAVLEEGMNPAAAGRRFGVSGVSVASWVKRWRERGHLRPDAKGGDLKSWRIEAERERIFRILERQPALTLRALRDRLAAEGAVFGTSTVQRFLKRHGLERQRPPRQPPPQTRGRPARVTGRKRTGGRRAPPLSSRIESGVTAWGRSDSLGPR